MWPRATNPENWLPQSQFIKVISTVRIRRTGGSEIHERVAQLFVVVHRIPSTKIPEASSEIFSLAEITRTPFFLSLALLIALS